MTSGNSQISFISNDELNVELTNNVVSSQDMITTVVTSLGLSVSDLEKVLKVKRATLYNWRKGGDVKAEDSLNRLKDVYEVAKVISEFNNKPFGRRAKTLLINGNSYFDLLENKTLNENFIVEHAKILKSQMDFRIKNSNKSNSNLNDINNISGEVTIYES